ncbi:MAG: tol-pal system protein YbgF [Gammaproteobacteria bacterium]|nr:tol-pal system protein YbgF [Gammaproteobacteria bacterium]
MKKSTWVILVSFLMSAASTTAFAAGNEASVEERLNRMERLVNSKGLVDIMVRVESMQSELQRLVGEIELQKHSLDEIKKRQRDLYVDIDRRLLQIERRSGSSAPSVPVYQAPIQTPTIEKDESTPISEVESAPEKRMKKEGEQVAYQKAFDLLRALRYEKATQAFRQFLNDYPDGRYAHIAQYWLAETSYHTRQYDVAVKDYQTLINEHPKSPKLADALLKIGYSQFELKSYSKAKTALNTLIKSYPGTTEAGQAENLLQKIRLQKVQ